ncbi:MAG: hypothetical protein NTV88_04835 [Candidatus Micrarchaeota archaeon]|nr:hypothetical protein [Candidatus Micrarchaeota archaeon]
MTSKRDIARTWIAAMKPGSRIGQNEKILGIYTHFLYSWLALMFLGKDKTTGNERKILKDLVALTPDPLISKIYTAMSYNITELAKLRVRNEEPRGQNSGYEEADKLNQELSGGNPRQIIDATFQLLYVIRCNLFHADKSMGDTRDNLVMFYASAITKNISWTLVEELP